jgi:PPM family protein phosphatase
MSTLENLTNGAAFHTSPGRRPVNEDAVLQTKFANDAELLAVADGMGGHNAGEVASRRALEVMAESLGAGSDLPSAIRSANATVLQEAHAQPEYRGMGTTIVALLRQNSTYTLANVGDSRAYRVDAGGIRQLTQDHSFVAEAVRSGQLSLEEAEKSRWRNAVTRCVGTDPELEVDCYGPFDAQEAHAVLLCTDGVYRALSADELRSMTVEAADAESAVRAIAGAAYEAGSDDNISVALIGFGAARERRAVDLSAAGSPGSRRQGRRHRPSRRQLMQAAMILLGTVVMVAYLALYWFGS